VRGATACLDAGNHVAEIDCVFAVASNLVLIVLGDGATVGTPRQAAVVQAQPSTDGLLDGAWNFLAVKPAPVSAQRNAEKLGRFCRLQTQAKKTLLKFGW
jgi:hypothetical protein